MSDDLRDVLHGSHVVLAVVAEVVVGDVHEGVQRVGKVEPGRRRISDEDEY